MIYRSVLPNLEFIVHSVESLSKITLDLSPMSTSLKEMTGQQFSSTLLTFPLRTLGLSAGSNGSTPDTPHSLCLEGVPPFVVPTRDHCLLQFSPSIRQSTTLLFSAEFLTPLLFPSTNVCEERGGVFVKFIVAENRDQSQATDSWKSHKV